MFKETVVLLSEPPKESGHKPENYIQLERILARLDEFLSFANEVYKKVGFIGSLYFSAQINGTDWMRIKFPINVDVGRIYRSPTGDFFYAETVPAWELDSEKRRYEVIKNVIQRLIFMFGWKDFNWTIVENYYKKNKTLESVFSLGTQG